MSIARLRALRLVGFKSFAEKTIVEFGPGISAVVGPNGSGKSNLADALRWALGEQGRSLRTRKSEDVIFAGSARRHGTGMADVTLVVDNSDRLLPLDYAEVELGRRLFRSGENEYLVNRQRVRLKDLVELLDAANLADNAFLFIGQGMVDQALALRPEERRPLFEEVAGVRRHEKRRRQAETELAEAEANLERVRDIVAELRPQARRLAAQAEQQAARDTAGEELAVALVATGRARWAAADTGARQTEERLAATRTDSDTALAALRSAEDELTRVTEALAAHAERERQRRQALDEVRSASFEARLAEARSRTELDAVRRDRARLTEEREATALRAETTRRELAVSSPTATDDADLERQEADERTDVEEALATAAAALRDSQTIRAAETERAAAARRAEEARTAERDRAARRAAELERRLTEQRQVATGTERAAAAAHEARQSAVAAAREAAEAEAAADAGAARARSAHETTEDRRRDAAARQSALTQRIAAIDARLSSLEASLEGAGHDRLFASARRRGGRRLLEGVEVDRALGRAVEVALGDAVRGVVVDDAAVVGLRDEQGLLLLGEARRSAVGAAPAAVAARAVEAARVGGGGALSDALRSDPDGIVGRLLLGVLWAPDLEAALGIRPLLPFGWRVATADGQLVGEDGVIRLGGHDALFERRAERDRLLAERRSAEDDQAPLAADGAAAVTAVAEAARTLADARRTLDHARRRRRLAEDDERRAVRDGEATQREAHWQRAQLERSEAELARARAALAAVDPADGLWRAAEAPPATGPATGADAGPGGAGERPAPDDRSTASVAGVASVADVAGVAAKISATEAASRTPAAASGTALEQLREHVERLRARRDALIAESARRRTERDRAQEQRRRAEVGLSMDDARAGELDSRIRSLIAAETGAEATLTALEADLAGSLAAEEAARVELERALSDSGAARARLVGLERVAAEAREALRTTEGRTRDAEVAEMEARLGLENAREALLVELAGIGTPGLAALRAEAPSEHVELTGAPQDAAHIAAQPSSGKPEGPSPGTAPEDAAEGASDVHAAELESALDGAITAWREASARDEPLPPPPPASRLAGLRRRFHDLGATNPFAATEYHAVAERLGALEAQRTDLERAIAATRQLIADLSALVATRFRDTFAALEGAFGRRFQQLFDGGDAQLTLTTPEDLSVTGIEITARPPGKKRQALAMLSGGERALTAVALLFAMLEVRPVPFCVLDEVDAALDEANVGRFGSALRGLAQGIQFVVITHNRATIEAADALYGVTVGDDAVSRVISLRMADPEVAAIDPRPVAVGVDGDGLVPAAAPPVAG